MYLLYGKKGSGSAAIEAALELVAAPYRLVEAASWEPNDAFAGLLKVNPLGQIPTLVLSDGSVLSESAAILIHLGGAHPESGLFPRDASARAQAVRGLVFIAANCYAAISIIDYPERWCADPAGPGAKAGVHDGDVIVKVGDNKVSCSLELERALLDRAAGDKVPVIVRRGAGRSGCPRRRCLQVVRRTQAPGAAASRLLCVAAADRIPSQTLGSVQQALAGLIGSFAWQRSARVDSRLLDINDAPGQGLPSSAPRVAWAGKLRRRVRAAPL